MNDIEEYKPREPSSRLSAAGDASPDAREPCEAIPQATLTVPVGGAEDTTYPLRGGITTLGRSPTNDIVLSDSTVSRRHCQIYWAQDAYVLEDLDSSNGTYLNDEQVQLAFLRDEDVIRVGELILQFKLVG
jgi:pSer/pThr/pTyr-binding forkhead associated (FHA) protein